MQLARAKAATLMVAVLLAAGCGTQKPAPVVDRSGTVPPAKTERPAAPPTTAAPAARTARDGIYTVQRGDTLFSIAGSFGVDARELARWNGLTDAAALTVGQTLRVVPPAGVAVAPVTPAAGGATEVRPLPPPGTEPAPGPAAAAPAVPGAAAPRPAEAPKAESSVQWQWPAPGKVIETFDETRNKGIDLAGNEGDPVNAAADGEVVYVGNALRGYGNLVIVKHNDEFISAYAHNRQVLVKQGQQVKRGQRIAEFGRSDATRVKLHFEIRRQGKPVDPLRYLPARAQP
jgi:lipoprotein NlpD